MSALARQERESLAQRERESNNEGARAEPQPSRRQGPMQIWNSEVDCHRVGTKTAGGGIRTVRSMPELAESSRLRTLASQRSRVRGVSVVAVEPDSRRRLSSPALRAVVIEVVRVLDGQGRGRWARLVSMSAALCRSTMRVVVVVVVNEVVRVLDEEVVVSCLMSCVVIGSVVILGSDDTSRRVSITPPIRRLTVGPLWPSVVFFGHPVEF